MRNNGGQALIETVAFFLAFSILLTVMCSFTKWMAIREKLLCAAKEGALLYSSGTQTRADVKAVLTRYLTHGSPELDPKGIRLYVGAKAGLIAYGGEFDQIRVGYVRPGGYYSIIRLDPFVEETCVVKHAPRYYAPFQPWGGPAILWNHG